MLQLAGPREPDLGFHTLEVDDDDEVSASYMDVSHPLAFDIRVVPASPNSSWMNLVFNDHRESRKPSNAEPPSGIEGG